MFIESVIYYYLFRALFANSQTVDPVNLAFYYIVVNMIALSMQPAQFVAWQHMNDINKGTIIPYLVRPVNYAATQYCNTVGVFALRAAVNLVLILGVSYVLGTFCSAASLALGLLSMLMGEAGVKALGIQALWAAFLGLCYIFIYEKYVTHNIETGG